MTAVPTMVAPLRGPLVAGLEPHLARLRELAPLRRASEIGAFVLLWAAGAAVGLLGLSTEGPAGLTLQVAGWLLVAVAFNAFMLLTHEGHHHLLARGRRLNHALTLALCLPLLHSPTAYRALHTAHHRHLGEHGDPDDYHNYVNHPRAVWALHWMRLTVGPIVYVFAIPFAGLRVASPTLRWHIVLEYVLFGACWTALFLLVPHSVLLQVWLLPLIPMAFFTAVRGLAQHGLTDRQDPYLSARTFHAHPVVAFCLLNENYHLEHHLFPEVPSYHLKALHELLWPRLPRAIVATSYLSFLGAFILRCLRGDLSPLGAVDREATA